MKPVVAQALVGQLLQRRRIDRAAERAGVAEAHVVEQNQQHVGRAFGRRRHCWDFGLGVRVEGADAPWNFAPAAAGCRPKAWHCARRYC